MTDVVSPKIVFRDRKPLVSIEEAKFLLLGLCHHNIISNIERKYNIMVHIGPIYIRNHIPNRLLVKVENSLITEVIKFG